MKLAELEGWLRDNTDMYMGTVQLKADELRELIKEAKTDEFERLYMKVVLRISADIAGDFDAALDQLEYNAAHRNEKTSEPPAEPTQAEELLDWIGTRMLADDRASALKRLEDLLAKLHAAEERAADADRALNTATSLLAKAEERVRKTEEEREQFRQARTPRGPRPGGKNKINPT